MLVSEKNAFTQEIEVFVERFGTGREALLPILQEVQIKHGYISDFAQQEVARMLDIHPVEVYGVVTFYSFLSTVRKGRYIIRLCQTISCDLADKTSLAKALERELGIKFGETTPDNRFTLEYTNCLGMCDQGPAMLINDDVYTKVSPGVVVDILKKCK